MCVVSRKKQWALDTESQKRVCGGLTSSAPTRRQSTTSRSLLKVAWTPQKTTNKGEGMRERHPWAWLGKYLKGTGRKDRRGLRPASRLAVERLEDRLTPSTVFWDGGGDNLNWSDARNWNNDALPTAADDVTI